MSTLSRSAARRVAAARMISYTGTAAAYTALVYVVFERTGSNGWVAAALLVTLGARGAVTPLAGSLGDRFDRRKVMISSDLAGAAVLATMALVRAPWLLLLLALVAVLVEAPFFPASGAALPNLVPPEDLAWANGTVAFGASLGYVVGPAVGGLLVAAGGGVAAFLIDALSFLASAALVASVRGSFSGAGRGDAPEGAHPGVGAGFRLLFRDPVLGRMTLAGGVFAISVGSILVAGPSLSSAFGAGALGYGLLATSFDVGAMFGALAGRRTTESTEYRWMVAGSFVTAGGLGAVAVLPAFPPILGAMVVAGASDGLVDVVWSVIFQRRSPDAVRSRVMAALETVFLLGLAAAFPVGAVLVGAFGPRVAYAVAGVGCTATATILWPLFRRRERATILGRTRALEWVDDPRGESRPLSVIESTIEGRYQVITRVASGGMGEVYRAHDAVLARDVAVKVLHANLAGDRGFVERFRREARAAAILNHPNVVGVYDWGTTDGTYFMVMEYVQGLNLRTLLAEYGRLEPVQVVEASLQVLAALDHAHGHGIVHRDVKPENILIARDGRLKVADFGLARAYADSHVSQAEGTVTGTVQYLAPEQVQGDPADPRTDLYALGVVMFELLTGKPPFTGETSLSIAYQHLSSRVPAPSVSVPTVPAALDRAVLMATERDRDRRPASARSLSDQLTRIAPELAPAEPLRRLAAQVPAAELIPEDRAPTVTIPRSISPRTRWARRVRAGFAIFLILLLLGVGGWATWVYAIPHYTKVPDVVGLTEAQAATRLQAAGLVVHIGEGRFSTDVPAGAIIATEPASGTKIRKGRTVVLIPSLGPRLIKVPDVTGQPVEEATSALRDAGFEVNVRRAFDDTVPRDHVISQNPDGGTKLEQGATVTLTVSKGPPLVQVPNVTGQLAADARQALESLGLTVNEDDAYSSDVPRGEVIETDPPAGTRVPKGSTVTMTVSKGPRTFGMPNVVGMSREDARQLLESLGLIVEVVEVPNPDPPDTVVFQDPPAGETVEQGQEVTIYVTQPSE